MIAAVVRNFNEALSLEQVDEPQCPENGVVLEVLACGVCRSDYHGWTGNHPLVKNGSVLGHEYCGVVVEAGAKAKYKIGDRLIALSFSDVAAVLPVMQENQIPAVTRLCRGSARRVYAKYVAVPFDHNLVYLPSDMSPALAAGLGCRVTTAWHALTDRADLRAGEWLAIHGTGRDRAVCAATGQNAGFAGCCRGYCRKTRLCARFGC